MLHAFTLHANSFLVAIHGFVLRKCCVSVLISIPASDLQLKGSKATSLSAYGQPMSALMLEQLMHIQMRVTVATSSMCNKFLNRPF